MWKDHTKQGSAISRHVDNCFKRNIFGASRTEKKPIFDPGHKEVSEAVNSFLKSGGKITKIDTLIFNTENLFNK